MVTSSPFRLDIPTPGPLGRGLSRVLARGVERACGLSTLADLYQRVRRRDVSGARFFAHALEALDIGLLVDEAALARLPDAGPVIVCANHPVGMLDGLALGAAVARVRDDVKVLGNRVLARIPELAPLCVPVDVYAGARAVGRNALALRQAVRWLRAGHVLVVFPAGQVAHEPLPDGTFADGPWSPAVARLARLSGAVAVPAYLDTRPSTLLRIAGRVHWSLRTVLFPRELLRQRGGAVRVSIAAPEPPPRGGTERTPEARTARLRARCYAMAPPVASRRQQVAAVAEPEDPVLLERELEGLPPEQHLVSAGAWRVAIAAAPGIPRLLREIGRLREVAFRAVGEGTGRACDIDRFDAHYLHLVLWDTQRQRLAGAYRMAPTDVIVARHGVSGLYTRTLFRFGRGLLRELGPSLELGRAFVAPEYQRDVAPLALLWRGIGAFVARAPRYRRLFGPVSLSADYPTVVLQAIVAFLRNPRLQSPDERLVRPRRPFTVAGHGVEALVDRAGPSAGAVQADRLIRSLDPQGRGLPVLLRQYLKLGARTVQCNVDPAFGNAVDVLVIVDLAQTDPSILARYMGAAETAAFLQHHKADDARARRAPVPSGSLGLARAAADGSSAAGAPQP